jgi:methyl-accepting chemotaxis protein PixJ
MVHRLDAVNNLDPQNHYPPNTPMRDRTETIDNVSDRAAVLEPSNSSKRSTTAMSRRSSLMQAFYNLPIGRKQLLALIACELIPILGFGVGSTIILTSSLRTQLLEQAKSEVAVTETNYNIKINQMGFGSRGQSDNTAIISVARAQGREEAPRADSLAQVKQILTNEVKARKMEYATLVGKDLRIIASANADRRGEKFDPDRLVSEVLKNPQQIKANGVVRWAELVKESAPLPAGLVEQDALIRYVVTPVKDPDTQEIIGALVFGDIVNSKLPIVEGTLKSFGSGYSAVYSHQPGKPFSLASSLDKTKAISLDQAHANITLPDTSLLATAAAAANGEAVTQRMVVGGKSYTIAAKAVPNKVVETANGPVPIFTNEPVAILVRGTPEDGIEALIKTSVIQDGVVLSLAVAVILLWSSLFRASVLKPLRQLGQTSEDFTNGDRTTRAEVFSSDEVGQLATQFNQLADNIVASEQALEKEAKFQVRRAREAKVVQDVISQIRRSLRFEDIIQVSTGHIREFLDVERIVVYLFNQDLNGGIIGAESVAPGWVAAIGQVIYDPLTPDAIERYNNGQVSYLIDVENANLSHQTSEILQRFQVKSNMVVPLKRNGELLGLLCAHQCSRIREWTRYEIDFFEQIGQQIGYALDQAALLAKQQEEATMSHQLNDLTLAIRKYLKTDDIMNNAVREMRKILNADRAIIYRFNPDFTGTIVAESVGMAWLPILGETVTDPFREGLIDQYRNGRVRVMNDVNSEEIADCHRDILDGFRITASMTGPFLPGPRLMGLVCIHQCSGPREWTESEINFFQQASAQLGFAIEQGMLFEAKEQARTEAEAISIDQRKQKETLQRQLLELLSDVEGAARGDLTVRADVTAGDIGTVADFFNSIVENLRQIVTQVKQAATRVNSALGENEDSIRQLATAALKQADETTQTLESVEDMTRSIRAVADSARQAATVARNASSTAEAGETAMDLTVQNILGLRETIGETAKKVKRLGESSQQISKVVSLINQIALQTNLLAINAGIEAARAGEEGQGFAVVAEEVGELAARSAAATREIEQIVDTIQHETSEVVMAMEQGTTQVVEGTRLVENAKSSLGHILEVSRQIDHLAQSISEATVSQVQTSQAITGLMGEVAQVAERTSKSSLQVSESLRETVEVAKELQDSVETFKVI